MNKLKQSTVHSQIAKDAGRTKKSSKKTLYKITSFVEAESWNEQSPQLENSYALQYWMQM